MSARAQIQKALAETIKEKLNGVSPYKVNIRGNVETRLKYWDEINDFPFICLTVGGESREYQPGNFKWGRILYSFKMYVNSDSPEEELEDVMADVERAIDENIRIPYDKFNPSAKTEDIRVLSITTDEGSLAPFGVGEITIEVLYHKT
jgi:hypothetical protein